MVFDRLPRNVVALEVTMKEECSAAPSKHTSGGAVQKMNECTNQM